MRVQALYPIATVCVLVLSQTPAGSQPQSPMPVGKGQRLEALAWPEAERVLTPETVVVLPVGAAQQGTRTAPEASQRSRRSQTI